jgi:hypothetical protein
VEDAIGDDAGAVGKADLGQRPSAGLVVLRFAPVTSNDDPGCAMYRRTNKISPFASPIAINLSESNAARSVEILESGVEAAFILRDRLNTG